MLMTKTIQIRDVPDDVHATLRARAAEAGVSLSDYVLAHIQRLASRPTVADVLLRAQGRAGSGPSAEAILEAVRHARGYDPTLDEVDNADAGVTRKHG